MTYGTTQTDITKLKWLWLATERNAVRKKISEDMRTNKVAHIMFDSTKDIIADLSNLRLHDELKYYGLIIDVCSQELYIGSPKEWNTNREYNFRLQNQNTAGFTFVEKIVLAPTVFTGSSDGIKNYAPAWSPVPPIIFLSSRSIESIKPDLDKIVQTWSRLRGVDSSKAQVKYHNYSDYAGINSLLFGEKDALNNDTGSYF